MAQPAVRELPPQPLQKAVRPFVTLLGSSPLFITQPEKETGVYQLWPGHDLLLQELGCHAGNLGQQRLVGLGRSQLSCLG